MIRCRKQHTGVLIIAASLLAFPSASPAGAAEKTASSYSLQSGVFGAGGGGSVSAALRSNGTVGQPTPIGVGAGSGKVLYAGFWKTIAVTTGVIHNVLPSFFRNALSPNFPNPFNPMTTIRYEIAETAPVTMIVYNVQGRRVRTLVNEIKKAGQHEIIWDGRDDNNAPVGSGIYLNRVQMGKSSFTKKMILVK